MKFLSFLFTLSLFISPAFVQAEYTIGEVERILEEQRNDEEILQKVQVQFQKGNEKAQKIIEYGGETKLQESQMVRPHEKVVLNKLDTDGKEQWFLIDKYRLPFTVFIFILFFVLITFIVGFQGILSLIGLLISLLILTFGIAPAILQGVSPLIAAILGSFIIATVSMFLAHGLKTRTVLALLSTLGTLLIAVLISIIFVKFTSLSGMGSEDAFFLIFSSDIRLNLQGILLAGIIIGTLGILDDVTTTQITAIEELKKSNPNTKSTQLFKQGFNIGREHILSMVNTLALAYAGASFPMFLMLTMPDEQPLWVSLNSELIIEEIVRTLVGSMALVLAVPISSFLGTWYYSEKNKNVFKNLSNSESSDKKVQEARNP